MFITPQPPYSISNVFFRNKIRVHVPIQIEIDIQNHMHTAHSYSKQRIMNPQNHAHVGHCRHGGGAGHSKHAQKCNCKGKLRHVAMHVSTIQIKTLHIQLDLLCTPQTNMGLNFK